jgi:ABC-type branched-subunit amino acid transport system substrate-binding protein
VVVLVLVATGVAALTAACARPAPPAEVIVGATVPATGSDAEVGQAARRGYERAVADENADGGLTLSGAAGVVRVRLEVRDDRSETPAGEQLAAELIEAGAHVLIATPNPVRAVPQAIVAERAGRPMLVNAVDGLGLPGGHMRWVFRVEAAGDDVEARARETMRAALALVAATGRVDAAALRTTLASR